MTYVLAVCMPLQGLLQRQAGPSAAGRNGTAVADKNMSRAGWSRMI